MCGATGEQVWSFEPAQRSQTFAQSLALVDDCNGDGRAEVLVASSGYDRQEPRVYLLSGGDGTVLRDRLDGPRAEWDLMRVAAMPDLDGDGQGDWAVAQDIPFGGTLFLYSSRDGGLLRSIQGGGYFGAECTSLGDVNDDGVYDLAVGNASTNAGEMSHRGRVEVLCGATGDVLFEIGLDGRLPRQH